MAMTSIKHPEHEVRARWDELIHQAPGTQNTQFQHKLNAYIRTAEA